MLFKQHNKSSPVPSTHCAMLYPQNGDRMVDIDSVTSLHPVYTPILQNMSQKENGNMKIYT